MTQLTKIDYQLDSLDQQKATLLKQQLCPGASNMELAMFLGVCNAAQLDPFIGKHICGVMRGKEVKKLTIQITIDGLRLIAERTGNYGGSTETLYLHPDGTWRDTWLEKTKYPLAAKIGIYHKDNPHRPATWGIAYWDEFAVYYGTKLGDMWEKMPRQMLAKCAEANGLKKAFPLETANVHYQDEPQQEPTQDIPHQVVDPLADSRNTLKELNQLCLDNEVITQAEYDKVLKNLSKLDGDTLSKSIDIWQAKLDAKPVKA